MIDLGKYWAMRGDNGLATQAIIGQVDLVDIVEKIDSRWADPTSKYYWVFENAILFDKPITQIKGKLNLWDCSKYIERR